MPIIKNNSGSLLGIGLPSGSIRLTPGHNQVDDSKWEESLKNKVIAAKVKEGILVEVELKKSFSELTASEQKSIVKGTFDIELLEKYTAFAKKGVKTEIEKQIKEINEKGE